MFRSTAPRLPSIERVPYGLSTNHPLSVMAFRFTLPYQRIKVLTCNVTILTSSYKNSQPILDILPEQFYLFL